ncbi:hypothetical protein BC628DRAFT_1402720 [Trametes gibbosa]|nr:hypothetical protein BC628DRAFT_1402720 [Trametes gibbosa]
MTRVSALPTLSPVYFLVTMPAAFCASSTEDVQSLNPEQILAVACQLRSPHVRAIKQCSISKKDQPRLNAKSNGFVHTVLQAYADHHHLVIRPDDVWIAILSQLSFYVNAHAEELREYFVAHEGKRTLVAEGVMREGAIDFAAFAREMAEGIRKNVVDNTLVEWILPDFTTTTLKDMTICSVIMMSTVKEFFEYRMDVTCGIPTVTLEGSKCDWVRLVRRLDRLYGLGDEPSAWANMLQPILRRFVSAFDGQPDTEFWTHVVHSSGWCVPEYLGGWLTAFCVWTTEGEWTGGSLSPLLAVRRLPQLPEEAEEISVSTSRRRRQLARIAGTPYIEKARPTEPCMVNSGKTNSSTNTTGAKGNATESPLSSIRGAPSRVNATSQASYGDISYTLDGVPYTTIRIAGIPAGHCEVDVTVVDNCREVTYGMIAGHVASIATAKNPGGLLDTWAPAPQWFMFEKTSNPSR